MGSVLKAVLKYNPSYDNVLLASCVDDLEEFGASIAYNYVAKYGKVEVLRFLNDVEIVYTGNEPEGEADVLDFCFNYYFRHNC